MEKVAILLLTVVAIVVIQKILAFVRLLRTVNHAGFRSLLTVSGISSLFPPIPLISIGNTAYEDKYKSFQRFDADIFTAVSVLPAEVNYMLADPQAIKEVVGSRVRFPKPVQLYESLMIFGSNIVASEHEEWKRYRKISGPAFTEPNNRLVWDETVKVMNDLFKNIWGDKKDITLNHALEITMPIALFIISAAGFGRRLAWNEELKTSNGHSLTFKDALYTVSEGIRIKLLAPKWAGSVFPRVKKVHGAFDELEKYMLEMIESRKDSEVKEQRFDLFSSLLEANDDNAEDAKLADSELLGNIFIFLIAGHETTAHTLCFALGLLALYPDEQERVYQEVLKAIPENRDPTFQDLNGLNYVNCVLNETLRMFPPVIGIPKEAAEDCMLTTTNNAGEKVTVAIPKAKYWEDPLTFKPSRFEGDWPRDAFLPFSGGVRSCLGRRFAELESIVAIAMLVKNYKITVKEEPEFAEETFEQRKARVLKAKNGLTLTPVRTPLVFTRRD
ncbi:hypothetical protein EUX98_g4419 [Antrodiella citrinella]|uniref:Cytochrome P450 n=1 Tax=Antrodiella citrinella TaxID=2447956 RepID=A0A4V3XIM5_9APHY|nr:hypothetical protein EUX98_g4419 [Antrodiella citrinella]